MKTDVIPLVVGLSLCGASAALLYIWFQTKDAEDECDAGANTSAGPRKISRQQSTLNATTRRLECVLPNNLVPLVQGRSGANVRAIEQTTGCRITFRDKDANNKICEITGPTDLVQKAADMVRKEATPPPILTEEIIVPLTACGKIIGRCGEALQEICRQSMAKVYVDSGDRSDGQTRRVLITGTQAHVNVAKTMIEEKIRVDAELRKSVDDTGLKREPRGKHSIDSTSLNGSNPDLAVATLPTGERLPAMAEGQLEVYVSAIASPSRFWLQLIGPQSLKLDSLVVEMTDYYSSEENRQLHKIADPYLGQIVAGLFKYDGKWYRAEIVGILPNEFNPRNVVLDLYFVDFGDSEYVAPHEVYELRTDFLTLRFQAIECFLANVKSTKEDEVDVWQPEAISRFEEVTHVAQWERMHARIVTTKERKYGDLVRREGSPVPGVELYDSVEGHEVNIASLLLREGHALDDSKLSTSKPASPSPPTVGPPPSTAAMRDVSPQPPSTNTFSAIRENTTNKNTQNNQIDKNHTKLNSHSFIEAEKRQLQQKLAQNGQSTAAAGNTDLGSKTSAFVMQQQATSTW